MVTSGSRGFTVGPRLMNRRHNTIINISYQEFSFFTQPLPDLKGAACHTSNIDPEIYFPYPRRYNRKELAIVKKVCDSCPVQVECLDYALKNNEEWGIWGGLTPKQRTTLKKKRKSDATYSASLVGGKFFEADRRGVKASG